MSALTEAIVLDLLRQRHTASGNGGSGEHAFLAHVRNAAGFDANRTFDAVALNLWPSRGLQLHVFEVKISRNDWRRELAKPDKAEDACRIADRFWIVAPTGCVRDGELPPTWGLIEVHGDGSDAKPWRLREKVAAPLLTERGTKFDPLPRGLVVGMLRSAPGAVPGGKVAAPTQFALDAEYKRGYERGKSDAEAHADLRRSGVEDKAKATAKLQDALVAAGVDRWLASSDLARHAESIAAALRGDDAHARLKRVRNTLQAALDALDGVYPGEQAAT